MVWRSLPRGSSSRPKNRNELQYIAGGKNALYCVTCAALRLAPGAHTGTFNPGEDRDAIGPISRPANPGDGRISQ